MQAEGVEAATTGDAGGEEARPPARAWSAKDLPRLDGMTAVVTGANSGVGFYTALELARAGASVVATCRDASRGRAALAQWSAAVPGAAIRVEPLDLADLASVRAFSARLHSETDQIDLLVNNAGVMAVPTREVTADGFERQMGTNHLGHFALTGLLASALRRARAPRVVTVSSAVATWGRVDIDNLQAERGYSPALAYAGSKLANLLFMLELGRRSPWVTSVAAHPGVARSNLQKHMASVGQWAVGVFGQGADRGALPSLYAAAGDVRSGEFYGPRHLFHMMGAPVRVRLPRRALDADLAKALWERSERLTGVSFGAGATDPGETE